MAMRGHPLGGSSTQQLETPHGRFVFKRSAQLGEGCAAKVYEGRDLESGQFVAVKVYKDIGRTSLHCFHNAIQVGKLLNGKSGKRLQDRTDRGLFVEVVAHSANHGVPGPDLGFLFHILELGGPSLEDVLATRYRDASALSMAELRDLHWSLFSMAYKLESLNLVHLDIKPSNIVSFPQSGNPQWKLVDLDCVVPAGAARCVVTKFGDITFTPAYIAPELARAYLRAGPGQAKHCPVILTPAMDIWSAGICALEAVVLASLLTDQYIKLQKETGSDHEFLKWLGDVDEQLFSSGVIESLRTVDADMARLLVGTLTKDNTRRLNAKDCLMHQWLRPISEAMRQKASSSRSLMAPTRSQLHMLERKSDTTSCKQSTATDEPVVKPIKLNKPLKQSTNEQSPDVAKWTSSTCETM
ncbi:unnamed protein product [Durusdinium trenchii]|uniref:Protein kinase domain-containing protein n=2 Tax=Durusdinium trenchii TaxID=1381693 RepID=A0ABP0QYY6_9DINO